MRSTTLYVIPLAFAVVLLLLQGCRMLGRRSLETEDFRGFEVTSLVADGTEKIRITGLVASSSLGIQCVERRRSGKEVSIQVFSAIARKGVEGNLDVTIDVPASVEKVTFGKTMRTVWKRPVEHQAAE